MQQVNGPIPFAQKVPYAEQYFEAMFGKELYRKVKLFKQTLEKHESKLELISYLSKED
jgi:hypothetical protein